MLQYRALSLIDGWGDEWRRTASLLAEIHNLVLRLALLKGGTVNDEMWADAEKMLPKFEWEQSHGPDPKVAEDALKSQLMRLAGF